MTYQKLSLRDWVRERFENCHRIAKQKDDPADRDGWLEDAEYFRRIHAILSAWPAIEPTVVECQHPKRSGDLRLGPQRCADCGMFLRTR